MKKRLRWSCRYGSKVEASLLVKRMTHDRGAQVRTHYQRHLALAGAGADALTYLPDMAISGLAGALVATQEALLP